MGGYAGSNCYNSNNSKLPNPFFSQTPVTSAKIKKSSFSNACIRRDGQNYESNVRNESIRACKSQSQLCVPDVFDSKRRRFCSAHFQFKKSKLVCQREQFSFNKCAQDIRFPTTSRLACQNRFIKCIFPPACVEGTPVLPESNLSRKAFADDLPSVRFSMCSKDLCMPVKLGGTDPQRQRNKSSSLLGRFFTSQSRPSCPLPTSSGSVQNFRVPGVENKLCKINPSPSEASRILGHSLGSTQEQKISSPTKKLEATSEVVRFTSKKKGHSKRNSKHSRVSQLCQFPSAQGSFKPPRTSQALQNIITTRPVPSESNTPTGTSRTTVVDRESRKVLAYSLPTHIQLFGDRCVRRSLGRSTEQCEADRSVVSSRNDFALQSKRNVSNLTRFKRSLSAPDRLHFVNTERQQVCGFVPEKRRGHQVDTADGSDLPDTSHSRSLQGPYRDSLSTRSVQCRSRSPVSLVTSAGMAPLTRNNRENILQMGRTCDRFVRVGKSACSSEIWDARCNRSAGLSSQCFQPNVELLPSVGVSTAFPNASSTAAPELGNRSVPSGGSSLEQSFLEARPQKPCPQSPIHDMQPESGLDRYHNRLSTSNDTGYGSRGVEMWGWSKSLAGWSQDQKQLLQKGWRESSLKTYQVAWQRWCVWANENSVSVSKPNGSDLGRFLLDLHLKHGLAYNTILVYKSAVSTLCDPDSNNRLSTHLLVKQALKSISIQNVKPNKAPIWDTDLLTNWLKDNQVDINNFYECSGRAAILLLLVSGRRIHDLTLLSVDDENCIITNNSVILWPKYGSKTDSVTNRQSGWRLLQNKDYQTIDPIFWLKRVIELSQSRRLICKQSNLFLTVCGKPKAASRTNIAGWVKKILLQAGIKASPGSVRPAVASKNWVQNCPIDEILARGNWKSENTFAKYYCREISSPTPASTSQSISNLFSPIN